MKRLIALSLVTLTTAGALVAAPVQAQQETKTQLVALDGKSVDRIQLRRDIDAAWVIDNQNILYRDTAKGHYLVTLKNVCARIVLRQPFAFRPSDLPELRANRSYEVRPEAGQPCDVAKIEQVDTARADTLRDASLRRVW